MNYTEEIDRSIPFFISLAYNANFSKRCISRWKRSQPLKKFSHELSNRTLRSISGNRCRSIRSFSLPDRYFFLLFPILLLFSFVLHNFSIFFNVNKPASIASIHISLGRRENYFIERFKMLNKKKKKKR